MKNSKISIRKLISVICWIVVAVFVVTTFLSATGKKKDDSGLFNLFGFRPVIVVSGSMEPAVMTNSISIMQYCSIDDVDVGDIIMYAHPDLKINITHRVIEENTDEDGNKYLTTKGDANPREDNIRVTSDMVVGKLVATYNETVPYVNFVMLDNGEVNTFALLQIIILISVVITVMCLLIYFVWNVFYSIFVLTAGKKYSNLISKQYKDNLDFQNNLALTVEALPISRKDSIRVIFGKIVLARELKAFEQSVKDLERAKNLSHFIAGKDFCNTGVEVEKLENENNIKDE